MTIYVNPTGMTKEAFLAEYATLPDRLNTADLFDELYCQKIFEYHYNINTALVLHILNIFPDGGFSAIGIPGSGRDLHSMFKGIRDRPCNFYQIRISLIPKEFIGGLDLYDTLQYGLGAGR